MSSFISLTLTLRPKAHVHIPMFSGVAVREWFLSAVHEYDAVLAEELQQGNGPRPFTVSPLIDMLAPQYRPLLIPERTVTFRLTGLTNVVGACMRTLPTSGTITLAEQSFQIEGTMLEEVSEQTLLQRHMLTTGRPRQITLAFRSPVVFRSHGVEMPVPLPELVFGSLIDRWNSLCDLPLHPQVREFARECLRISRYRLQTMRLHFGNSGYESLAGALGQVSYYITNPDPYWSRAIWALTGFAEYAGLGLRTAVGMGQVRLLTHPATKETLTST